MNRTTNHERIQSYADWHSRVSTRRDGSPSCAVWVPKWLALELDNDVGECRLADDKAACKTTVTADALDHLAQLHYSAQSRLESLASLEALANRDTRAQTGPPGGPQSEYLSRNTTITISRELKDELDFFAPKLSTRLGRDISAWHVLWIALAVRRGSNSRGPQANMARAARQPSQGKSKAASAASES